MESLQGCRHRFSCFRFPCRRGQPRLGLLLLRHPWSLCWHGRQDWRVVAPRLTRAKNRPPNSGSTPRPPARVANQNPRATSPTKSVHSPSNIRALGFVPELRRRGNFPHRTFLSECAGCRASPRLFARRTYRISASGRCILPSTLRWGHPPHPRQHDRSAHQPSFPPQTAWPTLALSTPTEGIVSPSCEGPNRLSVYCLLFRPQLRSAFTHSSNILQQKFLATSLKCAEREQRRLRCKPWQLPLTQTVAPTRDGARCRPTAMATGTQGRRNIRLPPLSRQVCALLPRIRWSRN